MGGSRTSRGHLVVVVAGAALVAGSFVPLWATYRISGLGIVAPEVVHRNAWDAYGLGMQLALSLAVVAAVIAATSGARGPRARLPGRPLLLGLCSATTALLVWQVAAGPQGSADPNGYGIDRGILAFAAPLLGACMTYGSATAAGKPTRRSSVGDDVRRAPGREPRGE